MTQCSHYLSIFLFPLVFIVNLFLELGNLISESVGGRGVEATDKQKDEEQEDQYVEYNQTIDYVLH